MRNGIRTNMKRVQCQLFIIPLQPSTEAEGARNNAPHRPLVGCTRPIAFLQHFALHAWLAYTRSPLRKNPPNPPFARREGVFVITQLPLPRERAGVRGGMPQDRREIE